jgi:DNA primase large subunit
MATKTQNRNDATDRNENRGQSSNMEDSPMMAHLLKSLKSGEDVGHYGRLTFAMVARHFIEEDELVQLIAKQPEQDEDRARALVQQVVARDYNPPRRERILEWQAQQDFPICPDSDDPNACNVYSDLRFPESVYDNINEYYEEQAESQS